MGKSDYPLHSLSTYLGGFPPRVPRGIIKKWVPGHASVLDPFCGSGTTLVEAKLLGHQAFGIDLNPLAVALSLAKLQPVELGDVLCRINTLARAFTGSRAIDGASEEIEAIYHEVTLAQLCFLREALGDKEPEDLFLRGCVLGIMHGKARRGGGTAYLSVDMPNTFSMSPEYVRKYIQRNSLVRPRVDVFAKLRDRARWLLRDGALPPKPAARVFQGDATAVDRLLGRQGVRTVGAVVTSPPYLGVLRYGAFNWIRLWFLGHDQYTIDRLLDGTDSLDGYLSFMATFLSRLARVLRPGALAALVVGDVKEFGHRVPLAERTWQELEGVVPYELEAIEVDRYDSERKTTRIWGERRRGRATPLDRILILRRVPRGNRRRRSRPHQRR
jgi:site-specific DNA-methyltransferase (adenine-specific)